MDGVFNINKPRGSGSFSIVSTVRKLSGERRVGHTGTLDREATGVLLVCIGKATRISEYLMTTTKKYRAIVELGITTDTYDATGKIVSRGDMAGIDYKQIESALNSFRGRIMQIPPMYSALKYQGRPLHVLARAGKTVERKSRAVDIYDIDIKSWQERLLTIEVVCSKGTYIRSLAYNLGQALGCGGMLKDLVRLSCGHYDIEDAITMPELEKAFHQDCWKQYLYSIDDVLSHWKSVTVSDEIARDIRNGQMVYLDDELIDSSMQQHDNNYDSLCRAYSIDGKLLALLKFKADQGSWQPDKVFQ